MNMNIFIALVAVVVLVSIMGLVGLEWSVLEAAAVVYLLGIFLELRGIKAKMKGE